MCSCLIEVLFVLLVQVKRFNSKRAAPDVSQEDHSHNYSVTNLPTETGFRYTRFTRTHLLCSYCYIKVLTVLHLYLCLSVTVILRFSKQWHILNVGLCHLITIFYLQDISLINYEKLMKYADFGLLVFFFLAPLKSKCHHSFVLSCWHKWSLIATFVITVFVSRQKLVTLNTDIHAAELQLNVSCFWLVGSMTTIFTVLW